MEVTNRDMARAFNVSERSLYMAGVVLRLRPELAEHVERGAMSLNEAHRLATGKAKPTSWDRLVKAWNNASEDDRGRFLLTLGRQGKGPAV